MSYRPRTELNPTRTFGHPYPPKVYPPLSNMVQQLNSEAGIGNSGFNVTYNVFKPGKTSSNAGFKPQQLINLSSTANQANIYGGVSALRLPLPVLTNNPGASVVKPDTKDEAGGITADEGLGTSNTLVNNGSTTTSSKNSTDDATPRAPPFECLAHYAAHLGVAEHKEVLQLQMKAMYESVKKELKNIHPDRGKAIPHEAIGMLFHMCGRLKTSEDVKYLACEIYDSFMIKFSDAMTKDMSECHDRSQLNEIEQRLQQQVLLRMGSCIQLASKVSAPGGFGKFITSAQLKMLLMAMQQNYSLKAINRSEARTVKHMDWKLCHVTSIHIIEILLIQLDLEKTVYRKIYHLATYILDYVYLNRDLVYSRLFELLSCKYSVTREKFREMVQFSKIIEGVSITATALFTLFHYDDAIFQTLEKVSTVDCGDFRDFASVVLKLLLEGQEQKNERKGLTPAVKMSSSMSIIT